MIYKDKVYGKVNINESVLIDVINTKALQRLKGINQYGTWVLLKPEFNTTRFEHSVGVCILLKKFDASLEEQIAGLLHDISHTAFSHVIDFTYNRSEQQDVADRFYKNIIMNSEIPDVLKEHGIDISTIINKKFRIMKNEIPDLCADRIDYLLRDGLIINRIDKDMVEKVLNNLIIHKNEFVFIDKVVAKYFAEKFIEMNNVFWANTLQVTIFKLLSDAIGMAISKNVISQDDIFLTDDELYKKLKQSNDKEVTDKLDLIFNLSLVENEKEYDFHIINKARYADPKILLDNKSVRLSEIDNSYKELMDNFIQKMSKGFFIRINK